MQLSESAIWLEDVQGCMQDAQGSNDRVLSGVTDKHNDVAAYEKPLRSTTKIS